MPVLDSVIVGAGQAGLGMSYFLKKKGIDTQFLAQSVERHLEKKSH
jgi:cation diffusion facilitator CzcD-associated flavoprotein CzcO